MKKLFVVWTLFLIFVLLPDTAFPQAQYLIDGVNPLALNLDSVPPNNCQTVAITLDPGGEITTALITGGCWLVYDPTQVSIGNVITYPVLWDPGTSGFVREPSGPGTFMFTGSSFGTVRIDLGPVPLCDVEFCCEGPGESQITISTVPGFDTVVGDTTVWDPDIADGIIDLWQVTPPCQCVLNGPDFVQISAFDTVTEQYTASPGPNCMNLPAYIWTDNCVLGDVDQTGLLYVPATVDNEDCTICVVDTANTDINTGEPVECCRDIFIGGDW